MQFKHTQHTTILSPKETHPIIKFFFTYAQLKNLYRQGWLKHKIPKSKCETVAEHSFSVALLSYLIAKEYRTDLDALKALQMGLFHDLAEVFTGDLTPTAKITRTKKHQQEKRSLHKLFQDFPNHTRIWQEFEQATTPEAKFVNQVDKLEMAMQALLYERIYRKNLEEFFVYVQQKICSPELKIIFAAILQLRKSPPPNIHSYIPIFQTAAALTGAFVTTVATYFISRPGCGNFPDALCTGGWPLVYRRSGGIAGFNAWHWRNFLIDIIFWSILIIATTFIFSKLLKTFRNLNLN